MCLGVPGQVVEANGITALVEFWGARREVRLDGLRVVAGDYIIGHAGSAVRRIPTDEVADTLMMYEIALAEAGEDPIVRDVVAQLEESGEFDLALTS